MCNVSNCFVFISFLRVDIETQTVLCQDSMVEIYSVRKQFTG